MKISVIMPTRNRDYVISNAIESILNQNYNDLELIIINNGSVDNSRDIILSYKDKLNLIYVEMGNVSISEARNIGLKLSTGELIAYLDDDNEWEKNYLSNIINEFRKNSSLMYCYSALEVYDSENLPLSTLYKKYDRISLLYANYIDINIFVHKKELLDIYGLFDVSLSRLVDWDFILRYTKKTNGKFLNIVGTKYYTTAKNRITENEDLKFNLHKILEKNYCEILELGLHKLIEKNNLPIWIRTYNHTQWHSLYCDFFKKGESNDKI